MGTLPKNDSLPTLMAKPERNIFAVYRDGNHRDNNWIVHAVRISVRVGIVFALWFTRSPHYQVLAAYMVLSEVIDQLAMLAVRQKESLRKWVGYIYVVNSVAAISVVGYFADWLLNDYFLVYLIHVSSATMGFGIGVGLVSFITSMLVYGAMLLGIHAPLITFLRIPIMAIIVLRIVVSQGRYEKAGEMIKNILDIEQAKKDFIAIASHNLRTPVAAIYGYIEVLLRGDAGTLNDQQKIYIQRIQSNNQELEKLTEQLLQVSILEVGREINLMKQPTQIEMLIQDEVNKLIPLAETKSLRLTFNKSRGLLPLVSIDVEKIKSVLSNLIDNAIKYTEKGNITVTARQEDGFIVVSVSDMGIGIAEEDLPKIFTKFYRSGNILVYNKVGIGLGLYLGRQIIELHGGKMTVESRSGQGSVFEFTLPILKEDILK